MKFKDLKNLDPQEITKKRSELELELLKARAQSARGTLAKDPHQISGIRRTLAQLATLDATLRAAASGTPHSPPSSPAKATKKQRTTDGGATNT